MCRDEFLMERLCCKLHDVGERREENKPVSKHMTKVAASESCDQASLTMKRPSNKEFLLRELALESLESWLDLLA